MSPRDRLAILAGGGPAPGINSVISAATIQARQDDLDVIGIQEGFSWLMKGSIEHVTPLTIEDVSRIHFLGGSVLGISRANPTVDPDDLERSVASLLRLYVTKLITIGGDDTAYSAMKLAEKAAGRINVVHVPKTIDNDLALPPDINTFGYQTARHLGVSIVKNIMVDAATTSRWYFIISMGRKTGHLALAIGKAASATLTLIPEEFGERTQIRNVVDTLVGAIIKRRSTGRNDGVAVIAEGVALNIDPSDLQSLEDVEKDAHGHVRISEIPVGELLKKLTQARLKELGIKTTIVAKNIGYELRCADPIPYDIDYTRDLGFCAAKYLMEGGSDAIISMQGGHFVPIPFGEMLDSETGRARIRSVDIRSARYAIARRYMIRLRREDFDDPNQVARYAVTANLDEAAFRERFQPLVENEPAEVRLRELPEK